MVAFYCWSNTMIVTATNIKLNYYKDEKADLFIRLAAGTSEEFINILKEKKVFDNVYYMQVPRITLGRNIIRYWKRYEKHYKRILGTIVQDRMYDIFISAGFWNDALYYVDYFYMNNKKMKVILMDEGGITYNSSKKDLCKYCVGGGISLKGKLKQYMPLAFFEKKYRRIVENSIYLYEPEWYKDIDRKMLGIQIPVIDNMNNSHELLLSMGNGETVEYYRKRAIIFIGRGNSKLIPDAEQQEEDIIVQAIQNINPRQIIYKTHPNMTLNRLEFGKKFEEIIFIDRDKNIIEGILSNVEVEKKIIVMYASSVAINIKALLDKEPVIIFTFRLFKQYDKYGDKDAEEFVEEIRRLYVCKEKIVVPNTMIDFIDALKIAYKNVLPY